MIPYPAPFEGGRDKGLTRKCSRTHCHSASRYLRQENSALSAEGTSSYRSSTTGAAGARAPTARCVRTERGEGKRRKESIGNHSRARYQTYRKGQPRPCLRANQWDKGLRGRQA